MSLCRCVAVSLCCCVAGVCVAVCCGVLQCVAVCCSVLQCVAVCCSVLPCVAMPLCCYVAMSRYNKERHIIHRPLRHARVRERIAKGQRDIARCNYVAMSLSPFVAVSLCCCVAMSLCHVLTKGQRAIARCDCVAISLCRKNFVPQAFSRCRCVAVSLCCCVAVFCVAVLLCICNLPVCLCVAMLCCPVVAASPCCCVAVLLGHCVSATCVWSTFSVRDTPTFAHTHMHIRTRACTPTPSSLVGRNAKCRTTLFIEISIACCSVLQCVAVCCSVLQCVAVSRCWNVLQSVGPPFSGTRIVLPTALLRGADTLQRTATHCHTL